MPRPEEFLPDEVSGREVKNQRYLDYELGAKEEREGIIRELRNFITRQRTTYTIPKEKLLGFVQGLKEEE